MFDTEIPWKIVSVMSIIAVTAGTGYCLFFLVRPFLFRRSHAGIIGITYTVLLLILRVIPVEMSSIAAYGMAVGAAGIVMCVLDRRNFRQKLFLSVTFFLLRWISMGLAIQLYSIVNEFQLSIPALAALETGKQFVIYIGMTLFLVGVNFAFVWTAVYMIRRVYVHKRDELSGRELVLYLLPSLSVMAGYIVLEICEWLYEMDTHTLLLDEHVIYECFKDVYQVISFVAIVGMIVIFQKIKSRQDEEHQTELLAGQVAQMKRHIAEVENLYEDIRSLKHDMGNHLMILENLYQKREKEEAQTYAESLRRQWEEHSLEIRTGNPVTDVIVSEQKKQMEEKGILFQCSFHYPEQTTLDAFDVSVILGNALTNAMDAVVDCPSPFVSLSSRRTKNAVLIEIRNSMKGLRAIDEESGLPLSTKAGSGHGYGLANIRKVAAKYHGEIDIAQEENEFLLTILLMNGAI